MTSRAGGLMKGGLRLGARLDMMTQIEAPKTGSWEAHRDTGPCEKTDVALGKFKLGKMNNHLTARPIRNV